MVYLFFFPYYLQQKINEEFREENPFIFKMLDYRVDYEKEWRKDGKADNKIIESPSRIFTNFTKISDLSPTPFLSTAKNYRFCDQCQYYVHISNWHCPECNKCVAIDGKPFRHCQICQKCVKMSWRHCDQCNECLYTGTHIHFKKSKRNDNDSQRNRKTNPQKNSPFRKRRRKSHSVYSEKRKRTNSMV
jgi:hypothetical protein